MSPVRFDASAIADFVQSLVRKFVRKELVELGKHGDPDASQRTIAPVVEEPFDVTTSEAAKLLGMSDRWVQKQSKPEGELAPIARRIGGVWRFRKSDVLNHHKGKRERE